MKKVFKKLFTLVTTLAVTLGLGVASVSATSSADTTALQITGLKGDEAITLYKIASAQYNATNDSFVNWNFAANATFADLTRPTSQEITDIASKIRSGAVTPQATYTMPVTGTTASYTAEAGIYIALISSNSGRVYNPILLAASYGGEGVLQTDAVAANASYLYGQTSVAKSSEPNVDKKVTNAIDDDGKPTASIGKVLTYTVDITLPSYPSNANNKTVWVGDTMSAGLTFDYSSLTVSWNNGTAKPDPTTGKVVINGVEIATAAQLANGFNMVFSYDNLAGIEPKLTYNGIVNKDAVVGTPGNTNNISYIYANDPTKGQTSTGTDKPTGEGLYEDTDSETVYTYELAFQKVDSITNDSLAGAVFGIYSDAAATQLVDIVTTNAAGYASSTQVGKGTYYIKEITAPTGYSLNTTVYTVEASWATATTKNSTTSTKTVYTSTIGEAKDGTQVGYLTTDGRFLALDTPAAQRTDALPAYVKTTTTTTATDASFTVNGAGSGTVVLSDVPNTKLSKLPSTGGVGTYLFTIIGVVIMAAAALFAKRSKKS